MDNYRPTRVVRFLAKLLSVFYGLGWVISGLLLAAVALGAVGGAGFSLGVPAAVDFHDARLQSTWTGREGGLSLQETDTTLRVPLAATPVPFRIATFVLVAAGLAILLLLLYHLRELFRRARDGAPFDPGNAVRLRWIAGLILAGHFLYVVVGGLLGRIVLATLTDSSVVLRPTLWLDERFLFGFNEGLVTIALILFTLAEIFKRGTELEDEQSLVV